MTYSVVVGDCLVGPHALLRQPTVRATTKISILHDLPKLLEDIPLVLGA
jgi:hypothetical protein